MMQALLFRLERDWRKLFWAGVAGAVLAGGISFLLPREYTSSMRLLVTQANVAGLDPYTALKSTEQIAGNIRELVYSSSISNSVLAKTEGFDASFFSADEIKRRKEWQEAVEVSVVPGTGILSVVAYHPDREQAKALVQGVSREIMGEAPNFGYNAQAKIIDSPLPSKWFVRPNFAKNALYGGALGLILAIIWLILDLDKPRKR